MQGLAWHPLSPIKHQKRSRPKRLWRNLNNSLYTHSYNRSPSRCPNQSAPKWCTCPRPPKRAKNSPSNSTPTSKNASPNTHTSTSSACTTCAIPISKMSGRNYRIAGNPSLPLPSPFFYFVSRFPTKEEKQGKRKRELPA